MADRLDSLVTGRIQRSYLSRDGWWARQVLEAFAFLEDRGYELADIHFHQQGNFITYSGARLDVDVYYEPESTKAFGTDLFDRAAQQYVPVDSLILERDPHVPLPRRDIRDQASVGENIRFWAVALEAMADEVL